jgi:hypothetical protein
MGMLRHIGAKRPFISVIQTDDKTANRSFENAIGVDRFICGRRRSYSIFTNGR